MFKNLDPTYIKFFIYKLSFRRNFIPLLSIYFLSLPNTTANQIGIFTGIWFIASFLLEIPSGYIWDTFWHKKTLLLWKILQILSMVCYLLWWIVDYPISFSFFVFWSIFQTVSFAFASWTSQAFFHEILDDQWKWKEYTKIMWKIGANVSLISVFFIVLLPFLTKIDIKLPFLIWLWFDIIGLFALSLIPNPRKFDKIWEEKDIFTLIKEAHDSRAIHVSTFLWIIIWFSIWENAFRNVYLEDLWYPIVFIGFVMWFSRIVWFLVWQNIHKIEKYINMRKYFFFELFLFPIFYLMISYFNNPYVVWLLFSIIIWYWWGRTPLMHQYLLENHVKDKNYKATILSIKWQISNLISILVIFLLWFFMSISYKVWYTVYFISLFLSLVLAFNWIYKKQ